MAIKFFDQLSNADKDKVITNMTAGPLFKDMFSDVLSGLLMSHTYVVDTDKMIAYVPLTVIEVAT